MLSPVPVEVEVAAQLGAGGGGGGAGGRGGRTGRPALLLALVLGESVPPEHLPLPPGHQAHHHHHLPHNVQLVLIQWSYIFCKDVITRFILNEFE